MIAQFTVTTVSDELVSLTSHARATPSIQVCLNEHSVLQPGLTVVSLSHLFKGTGWRAFFLLLSFCKDSTSCRLENDPNANSSIPASRRCMLSSLSSLSRLDPSRLDPGSPGPWNDQASTANATSVPPRKAHRPTSRSSRAAPCKAGLGLDSSWIRIASYRI